MYSFREDEGAGVAYAREYEFLKVRPAALRGDDRTERLGPQERNRTNSSQQRLLVL